MARPIKNNADYFSHDSGMRNDIKIKAIRRKFGNEGYAIWVMLLEHLTDCVNFQYNFTEINIELLAADFDIETENLKSIIDYFTKLELIVNENGYIKSYQLIKRFEGLLSKRKRTRKTVMDVHNTQSKVKESKVNNSKVKKRKEEESKIKNPPPFSNINSILEKQKADAKRKKIAQKKENGNNGIMNPELYDQLPFLGKAKIIIQQARKIIFDDPDIQNPIIYGLKNKIEQKLILFKKPHEEKDILSAIKRIVTNLDSFHESNFDMEYFAKYFDRLWEVKNNEDSYSDQIKDQKIEMY